MIRSRQNHSRWIFIWDLIHCGINLMMLFSRRKFCLMALGMVCNSVPIAKRSLSVCIRNNHLREVPSLKWWRRGLPISQSASKQNTDLHKSCGFSLHARLSLVTIKTFCHLPRWQWSMEARGIMQTLTHKTFYIYIRALSEKSIHLPKHMISWCTLNIWRLAVNFRWVSLKCPSFQTWCRDWTQ